MELEWNCYGIGMELEWNCNYDSIFNNLGVAEIFFGLNNLFKKQKNNEYGKTFLFYLSDFSRKLQENSYFQNIPEFP